MQTCLHRQDRHRTKEGKGKGKEREIARVSERAREECVTKKRNKANDKKDKKKTTELIQMRVNAG
jgi:hypothetical protein